MINKREASTAMRKCVRTIVQHPGDIRVVPRLVNELLSNQKTDLLNQGVLGEGTSFLIELDDTTVERAFVGPCELLTCLHLNTDLLL